MLATAEGQIACQLDGVIKQATYTTMSATGWRFLITTNGTSAPEIEQ